MLFRWNSINSAKWWRRAARSPAGIGLAIAIADVACLIYHHKHHLPMAHDSIGNAVFILLIVSPINAKYGDC